jgi:hypothetical protein
LGPPGSAKHFLGLDRGRRMAPLIARQGPGGHRRKGHYLTLPVERLEADERCADQARLVGKLGLDDS